MRPNDDVRLLHLREAANTAIRFTEGRTRSDLDVHHYFDIDLDVLWATISKDLPSLLAALDNPSSLTAANASEGK